LKKPSEFVLDIDLRKYDIRSGIPKEGNQKGRIASPLLGYRLNNPGNSGI
jgi:hypothetical protein